MESSPIPKNGCLVTYPRDFIVLRDCRYSFFKDRLVIYLNSLTCLIRHYCHLVPVLISPLYVSISLNIGPLASLAYQLSVSVIARRVYNSILVVHDVVALISVGNLLYDIGLCYLGSNLLRRLKWPCRLAWRFRWWPIKETGIGLLGCVGRFYFSRCMGLFDWPSRLAWLICWRSIKETGIRSRLGCVPWFYFS